MKVPNQFRLRTHPIYGTTDADGCNGAFQIPLKDGRQMFAIVSDGLEAPMPNQWEHVSISIRDATGETFLPTWDEMCLAKETFWGPEETVVQFHPPRSQYVNNHPKVLPSVEGHQLPTTNSSEVDGMKQ
jgi:hypothetical protein